MKNILVQGKEKRSDKEVDEMVKSILIGIIKCDNSTKIANEIIHHIADDLSNDQLNKVESVAQKLHKIQAPEVSRFNRSSS